MGIGLILSVAGLILLAPIGHHGRGLIADPALRFDTVAVLLAAGISVLLTSRRPLAFWLVLTIVGSIGYVSERSSPWAPPGWHDRVLLISVVLFAAAALLAAVPAPRTGGPALVLTAAIGGILWLGRHYPSLIGSSTGTRDFLVDAFFALATVVLARWLRAAQRSRAGFVLTAGGIAAYTLEQARPWAPAGWHDRIAVVAAITTIIGITASIADYVVRESYGMAFVAGAGWGLGAVVVRHQQPWQARIGPGVAGVLDIVSVGLLVVAVTALICFAIQVVTEARRQYREEADVVDDNVFAEFGIPMIVLSGGCFLLAGTALTALRVFEQSSAGTFGLCLLVLAGLAAGFAGVWAVLAAVADRRDPAPAPRRIDELPAFLVKTVTIGPGVLGPGPAIAYAGVALLLSCTFVLNTTVAWFTIGLAGGALVVAGATLSCGRLLRRLGEQAATDPGSVRLSERHVREQQALASKAAAAGGAGVVLLFMVRSQVVPTPLRAVLSLLVVAGFVVASEAPVQLLVALADKRDEVGWNDAKRDRRLRRPTRLAVAGLILSVAGTIWVTSFDLADWVRAVCTLAAILGFCSAFAFGVFAIVTIVETIRTGDRTVADRARRIATTKDSLFRLLPAPRCELAPVEEELEALLDLGPPGWAEGRGA